MSYRTGQKAIQQEAKGLQALAAKLPRCFDDVVQLLLAADLIIFTGIGKSGHVARKLASTCTSMGSRSVYIHPTEAVHGDLGVLTHNSIVVGLSRSGTAPEVQAFFQAANVPCVLISENEDTVLAARAQYVLKIPKVAEAWGHAPTTSTVMQMAIGDALSVALAEARGFTEQDFKATHPGGALGKM